MQVKKSFLSLSILGVLSFTVSAVSLGQTYYVQPGDSLYSIAARYGTSIDQLQRSNGLGSAAIYPGQALQVYSGGTASGSSSSYTVKPGDSLFIISQKYGVSIDALKQANGLSGSGLWVGQVLTIPKSTAQSGASGTYRVQSGDSLFLIAQKLGVTMSSLLQANNMSSGSMIYPGQILKVPTRSQSSGYSYYNYSISSSDLDLLARLVTAESDGEPYEGQVAVASTILNRLRDPRYPKTVPGIIYQIDNGRYQYSPVLDGRINTPASSSALRATQAAISGWDPSNGANGFYNPSKTVNQWVRSQAVTAAIGNHVFFSY